MAQPKAHANVHLQDQGLKQTWSLSIENQENAAFLLLLLYKVCDEECVSHTRWSLHVHQDVEGHLKLEKSSFEFAMTAELKKWRRIFYRLSLHLK